MMMVVMLMVTMALLRVLMQVMGTMLLLIIVSMLVMVVMMMRMAVFFVNGRKQAVGQTLQLMLVIILLIDLNHLHVDFETEVIGLCFLRSHGLLVLLAVTFEVLVGIESDQVDGPLLPRLANLLDLYELRIVLLQRVNQIVDV